VSNPPEAPTILLYVEDELLVQDVTEDALREAGYEVVTASSGAEAIALVRKLSKSLRGVVTDVNLGKGENGWDVARRARESIAGVPVVYVSGANEGEWTSRGVPNSMMIAKPFAPAQVVTAMSSLLNAVDSAH
jgi:DNA-binding response OmpR family regulator